MTDHTDKPSSIGVSDMERLVDLRFLLEIALQQARDATAVGRHAATILLDGVNELALALAVSNKVDRVPPGFWELMKKAHSAYQTSWDAPGRKGVEELHRARNLVQHHGVSSDPANLARWAADTERFVRSLVDAAFEVELRNVVRADAVIDPEIRSHLRAAEEALSASDGAETLKSALEALRIATSRWRSQWEDADPTQFRSTLGGGLQDDGARGQLQRLTLYTEVLPFSLDLGEFVWLRSLERATNADVPVDARDAERALSFVLAWILRWEAFWFSYTEQRIRRWRESLHPPITGEDQPPQVIKTDVEYGWFEQGDAPRFVVHLLVANPPIDDAEKWSLTLKAALKEEWSRAVDGDKSAQSAAGPVRVSNDGTVTFQQVTGAHTRYIPDVIKVAIPEAVRAIQEGADAQSRWETAAKEMESEYRTALSDLLSGEDRLLDDLEVTASPLEKQDMWLQIVLADHLGSPLQSATVKALQETLGSHSLYYTDNRTIQFREPPPPDRVIEICKGAVEAAIRVTKKERRAQEQLDQVRDEIRSAMASIVGDRTE